MRAISDPTSTCGRSRADSFLSVFFFLKIYITHKFVHKHHAKMYPKGSMKPKICRSICRENIMENAKKLLKHFYGKKCGNKF
jgi:hypothetical protein